MNPVDEYEAELRKFLGVKHALSCSSGSAALHLALSAVKTRRGAVLTTPYTFPATSNAIIHAGLYPVFVDVDPDLLISKKALEKAAEMHSVVGILPVHLFGRVCDMPWITLIAEELGAWIVEDASQAFGAEQDGRRAGTFGDAGTFSTYASKNLSTYEGGIVATGRDDVAEKVNMLRNHGFDSHGEMQMLGYNYKLGWDRAFAGQQALSLHKPGILAELGRYGPADGYYPRLVYEHAWYREHPEAWHAEPCPNAAEAAKKVREKTF